MPEVASPHTVELLSMHVSSGLETHTQNILFRAFLVQLHIAARGWKRRKNKLAFCMRSEELEISGNLLKMTRLRIGKSSIVFSWWENQESPL